MLVVLVVSERRASACLIMLSAKQGSHCTTIFNAFGLARPGIETTTSCSRSGRSTICAIGTGVVRGVPCSLVRSLPQVCGDVTLLTF